MRKQSNRSEPSPPEAGHSSRFASREDNAQADRIDEILTGTWVQGPVFAAHLGFPEKHCAWNSGIGSIISFCLLPPTDGLWCDEHDPARGGLG